MHKYKYINTLYIKRRLFCGSGELMVGRGGKEKVIIYRGKNKYHLFSHRQDPYYNRINIYVKSEAWPFEKRKGTIWRRQGDKRAHMDKGQRYICTTISKWKSLFYVLIFKRIASQNRPAHRWGSISLLQLIAVKCIPKEFLSYTKQYNRTQGTLPKTTN